MVEARRLLGRMRRSRFGWTAGDLDRLYRSFNFDVIEATGIASTSIRSIQTCAPASRATAVRYRRATRLRQFT